jgi:hypothetical protein
MTIIKLSLIKKKKTPTRQLELLSQSHKLLLPYKKSKMKINKLQDSILIKTNLKIKKIN